MSNIFDKAYEVAAELTHKWVEDNLKNGNHVSEYQIAHKFSVFYENAVLDTKIDVLNF